MLHRPSKVLIYASCSAPIPAYGIVSVPAKDHGQGARGGTETAFHRGEGLQDGMFRAYSYIYLLTPQQIDEYLFHGFIPEVGLCSVSHSQNVISTQRMTEDIRKSQRFASLSLFTSVYCIGPITARKLYDRGLRSLHDLEAYYEVDTGFTPVENSESTEMDIRIALGLRDDLMLTCGHQGSCRYVALTLAQNPARRG